MIKRKQLITLLAEFRIRISRGQGLFYDFRNALVIGASLSVILKLSEMWGVILSIIAYAGFFVVGGIKFLIDLSKEQSALSSSKYNPHLNKLSKLIK